MIMSNKLIVCKTEENKRNMHTDSNKKYAVIAINVHTICTTLNEKSRTTHNSSV